MRPLKETLNINSEGELSEIIQRSGKQIGWIVVSVNTNEIEFHHSTMMTKMITLVSWTEAGNINISTSHKQKSVKVDIGGLRKGQNNKFILAVQREMAQTQKAVVTETERGSDHKKKGLEQGNLYTPSPDDFSKQIAIGDKKKKSLVMWIVIGVALVGAVSVLVSSNLNSSSSGSKSNNKVSGCTGNGSQNCISEIRQRFKNTGKDIVGEQYEGDGIFEIQFIEYGKGTFNAYIRTDCDCEIAHINVSPL